MFVYRSMGRAKAGFLLLDLLLDLDLLETRTGILGGMEDRLAVLPVVVLVVTTDVRDVQASAGGNEALLLEDLEDLVEEEDLEEDIDVRRLGWVTVAVSASPPPLLVCWSLRYD